MCLHLVNVLIDIPDKIHRRLKTVAAIEGVTLREKIIEFLGILVHIDDDPSWNDLMAETIKEEQEETES